MGWWNISFLHDSPNNFFDKGLTFLKVIRITIIYIFSKFIIILYYFVLYYYIIFYYLFFYFYYLLLYLLFYYLLLYYFFTTTYYYIISLRQHIKLFTRELFSILSIERFYFETFLRFNAFKREYKRPLFCIFPCEILHDNRIKWKKRKRISSSTSKLAVRRRLDEVTRAKLSRASCVTRVARNLSVSLAFSLLSPVIVAAGQSLDFSRQFSRASRFLVFSRARLFGSVCVHGFAFHAKIRTGSLTTSSPSSSLLSSLFHLSIQCQ